MNINIKPTAQFLFHDYGICCEHGQSRNDFAVNIKFNSLRTDKI